MEPIHISDPNDARLHAYRSIQDRDREGIEGRPGRFIGETALVLRAMLAVPGCVESILAASRHESLVCEMLAEHALENPAVFIVPEEVVQPLTGFNLHRGLLAIGRRPAPRTVESIVARGGPLLCVEGVNNLDNIGQLFRIAAAFGCCGALLSPTCHDPLYRKSLRVSCGCALKIPFVRSSDWLHDLRAVRDSHGFALMGATGGGELALSEAVRAHHSAGGGASARTAILVGAEFNGLTAEALALCHQRVRIPMAPGVDSLNVAVAAAVFLSHFAPEPRR